MIKGTIVKRYKRFIMEVAVDGMGTLEVYCPNTGKMIGISEPGLICYIIPQENPKAKYKYRLYAVETPEGELVGGYPALANDIFSNYISSNNENIDKDIDLDKSIKGHFTHFKREVKYGNQNSRIDFLLKSDRDDHCYLEVKNAHLVRKAGLAEFPDTVTTRGSKHLEELMHCMENGHKACVTYVVQREDCSQFSIAGDIDPNYYSNFKKAMSMGLICNIYTCKVSLKNIEIINKIPLLLI